MKMELQLPKLVSNSKHVDLNALNTVFRVILVNLNGKKEKYAQRRQMPKHLMDAKSIFNPFPQCHHCHNPCGVWIREM